MSYFQFFPLLEYQFAGDANTIFVTNILKRTKVRDSIIEEASLYDLYFVRDGETPDVLSAKIYGTSEYHWVLLLTNKIIDPNFDWPMPTQTLHDYMINKYGSNHLYEIHHYELVSPYAWRNGMVMPHDAYASDFGADLYNPEIESINPVTNEEYEERLNDDRRQIKILKAELLPEVVREFGLLIKE